MSLDIRSGFLWCISVSCLLIFDFFLFETGNPSITGHIGLFWITPIVIVMIVASSAPGEGETWSQFILHVLIVGLLLAVLFVTSPYAEEFAAARLETEIDSFIKDPINSKADVLNEQRQLMTKVKNQKFSMERETFMPSFRRMDYLLEMETGEKYRLIVSMNWSESPQIWFRQLTELEQKALEQNEFGKRERKE